MTSRRVLPLQDDHEEEPHQAFVIEEATASPSPSTSSMLFSYPITLSPTAVSADIIRLNIGGVLYTTTKATLVSRGSNFFGPLLDGQFGRLQDSSGAYFIDRNGRWFAPILDYLRQGVLVLPVDVKIEQIVEEAKYYSIDLLPGLCGDLKEGLYTSSNWILYFERDPDHPWIFGITGVEEKSKRVFIQEPCFVKDGSIHWRDYLVYTKNGKLYIWSKSVFKSKTQLYYRTPKNERFPSLLAEGLVSDRRGAEEAVHLNFSQTSQGISCRSYFAQPTDNPKQQPFFSKVIVLCKSLIIMAGNEEHWLLYLHSDLAFFTFNHPFVEFSDSFHLISHK
jgi:hypothetical protein